MLSSVVSHLHQLLLTGYPCGVATSKSVRFLRSISAGQLRRLTAEHEDKIRSLIVPGPTNPSHWWMPRLSNPRKQVFRLWPVQPRPFLRIALVREGCTNRPFYTIQVKYNQAHSKDMGIEQLGSWDPFPNKTYGEQLIGLNLNRIFFWMSRGAEPTQRAAELLGLAGVLPVHPRSYLVAHRARCALAERLRTEALSTQSAETTPETASISGADTATVDADEDDETKYLKRPDAIWRPKRSTKAWWRLGLM